MCRSQSLGHSAGAAADPVRLAVLPVDIFVVSDIGTNTFVHAVKASVRPSRPAALSQQLDCDRRSEGQDADEEEATEYVGVPVNIADWTPEGVDLPV